jgi:hypothetical protein
MVFIYLNRITHKYLGKKCLSDIGETRTKAWKTRVLKANCSAAQNNCSAMQSTATNLRYRGAFFTKLNIFVFRCLPLAKYLGRDFKRTR